VLPLQRCGFDVPFTGCGHLLGRGSCLDPVAAVVTHPVDRHVVDDGLVVHIGDVHVIDIVDGTVVVHAAALPIAALVAVADVAVSIIHAAVEADVRTPVTRVP
jgi:hypothetical protein